MIDYMTASTAAEKWNISHRRVITLCSESRIENVTMLGNMWLIPINATKPIDARTTRYDKKNTATPFLKWAGGKGQLLDTIRDYYPKGLGKDIKKYCEPMVGAGAVLFDIVNSYDLEEILINDYNNELINIYEVIKTDTFDLIKTLKKFEDEHLSRNDDDRKEYYYSQRDLFNSLIHNPDSDRVLKASLFIYLNKTCFNGLYRVNKKGSFNVPMGAYKNPAICDEKNLILVSEKLQKVKIMSGDYSNTRDFIDENTFVYFDPPYRPLTKTAEFTSYTETDFSDDNQIELADFVKKLSQKGAKVLLSNSDPKNTNSNDEFFDELYKSFYINRISAKRSINRNAKDRGKISELLISNY